MPRTAFYMTFVMFLVVCGISIPTAKAQYDTQNAVEEDISSPSYTVENIEVDVTADNAVAAREKAFEEAQIKGYKMLAERFLSPEEMESFEAPDINSVSALVKDYEVTNEKLSAVRYKGIYKIRYSKNSFGGGAATGSKKSASLSPPSTTGDILVLPFYETSGRTFLWQVNPFLEAWIRARNSNNAGRAIIPLGDIEDISQIHDDQALTYDSSRLNAMRLRYRAKNVALMIARPEVLPDGSTNIMVSLYNVKPYGPELARQISVRGYHGEMPEQRYNRVVREVLRSLGPKWQKQAPVQNAVNQNAVGQVQQAPLTGPVGNITAQINFNNVREWVEIKRSVERAYGVKSLEVKSLFPRSAMIKINFQGDIQMLRQSLQRVGVGLNDPQSQYSNASNAGMGQAPIYQLRSIRAARRY